MKTTAKKTKTEKQAGRLNLPDMSTPKGIVLGLNKVIRLRTSGRINSSLAKDLGYLAGYILKALDVNSAPDGANAAEVASKFSEVVSNSASGTVAYDYKQLSTGADPVQDGTRRPEELQDGMGETPSSQ